MDEQIKLLLRRDKMIYAVYLVRQQKGWGLREAKDYVEQIERSMKGKRGNRKLPQPSSEIESQAYGLLRRGQKEEAIELIRQKTVMRRKEAQAYIESLIVIDSIQKQTRQDSLPFGGGFQQRRAQVAQKPLDNETLERTRQILQQQGKVEAIKFVRQGRNMGLREAKELVDSLAAGASSDNVLDQTGTNQGVSSEELEHKARQLLAKGWKFDAIKFVRQAGRMGLREAKEYVEAL